MKRLLLFLTFFLSIQTYVLFAQQTKAEGCVQCNKYLYWTGEVSNDFFNERNWRVAVQLPSGPNLPDSIQNNLPDSTQGRPSVFQTVKPSCLPGANKKDYQICLVAPDLKRDRYPALGTLTPGEEIIYNLYANGATIEVNGSIVFGSLHKGFTLDHVNLNIHGSLSSGVMSIDSLSTVHFYESNALGNSASVNLLDSKSWVYLHQDNPDSLLASPYKLWVKDTLASVDQNLRINQYYHNGSLVRKKDSNYSPLTIFSTSSLSGSSASLQESIIYSGSGIPSGMDNRTQSFVLRRGYMATFAIQENGTGKSKVYIASEADLVVNDVPLAMQNNISFIRVLPWNWVIKKGVGSTTGLSGVAADWFYNWGNGATSKPNYEYVPMTWGNGAASPASISQIIQKDNVTHLLGFNEPDNCSGQSGQYGNLCQPEVAVAYYENLMGTGMRLGSPATRENGPTTWLKDFNRIAKEHDVRFDFVAVHWYDWGSNPQNSPYEDPQKIFNRFKSYLATVYQTYGLPIWITEFNANPNRDISVNQAFLSLALPYLEQLDYIERYAYFEPMSGEIKTGVTRASYFDASGNYTIVGTTYRDQTSTPSIPELTYASPNNLDGMDKVYVEEPTERMGFEAECGLYKGNKWVINTDSLASNNYFIQPNSLADGVSAIAAQTHFEFESDKAQTLRVWVRLSATPGTSGTLKIRMDDNDFETINQMNSSDFTWFRIPRYYDVSQGRHRLSISYANDGTKLDKIVLINNSTSVNLAPDAGNTACTLPTKGWGLVATDVTYWAEAEAAQAGSEWSKGTDNYAIGGMFMQPIPGVTAISTPPASAGLLRFQFDIANDDEYSLWGKLQALSDSSDAYWFSVDGEPFRKWDNLQNKVYQWYWQKFYFTEGTASRNFTYFLSQGQHSVVVAYSEAGSKIDRIAIASTQRNPALEDPNVLLKDPVMDFEAENATLLGTASKVDCVTASNGKQVSIGTATTNGVRFSNIATQYGGNYRLAIRYMSKVTRNFKLIVNGVDLGANSNYSVIPSGNWCYEGGSPANFYKIIALNAGSNTLDIKALGTDAPFIDKISLVREFASYEAENATLTGDVTIENCSRASNGLLVNPKTATSNSVLFNNVKVDESATYYVDIHYVSKVARSASLFINGVSETVSFDASGNWCYESGPSNAPKVKSLLRALLNGVNTIEIKPTGTDAPLIDKISILKVPDMKQQTSARTATDPQSTPAKEEASNADESSNRFLVYPNPAEASTGFSILVGSSTATTFDVQILDINGREMYNDQLEIVNQTLSLNPHLNPGMYLIVINDHSSRQIAKLIVR